LLARIQTLTRPSWLGVQAPRSSSKVFRDRAAGSTAILAMDRLVPFNDVLSQLDALVSMFRQIKTAASKSTSAALGSSVGNLNQVTRSATFSLFWHSHFRSLHFSPYILCYLNPLQSNSRSSTLIPWLRWRDE